LGELRFRTVGDVVTLRSLYLRKQRQLAESTCLRWVDGELADMTVDVFGCVGVLSTYRTMFSEDEALLLAELAEAGVVETMYLKRRPKEARRSGNALIDVAPELPAFGPRCASVVVREHALHFEVRPANGLSVGLYLDARPARDWVTRNSVGKRVLNLFAYTCGFGLAAASGGAARAVNVDASRKVLDWGETNYRLNGLSPDPKDFIAGDAFEWLRRLSKTEAPFDLVILDPPGFATTKASRFSAKHDYPKLVAAARALLARRGTILAMCNVADLSDRDFGALIKKGMGDAPHTIVHRFGAGSEDFRPPHALKCFVVAEGPQTATPRAARAS
jgi:23S rRNA (cytosine1962-C5)-methyltransferase